MPIKSKAQRRKFAQLLVEGEISPETFEAWNRDAGSSELPERLHPKSGTPAQRTVKSKRARKTTPARKTKPAPKAKRARKGKAAPKAKSRPKAKGRAKAKKTRR